MRSLIIIEVEHGETTDGLDLAISNAMTLGVIPELYPEIRVNDWTVRVDLPPCFVLDSGNTEERK